MHLEETHIKNIPQYGSFFVLLVVTCTFGAMNMPAEMGLSILAGALGLAFSNIDKISRFKGAGFEAEMNMVRTLVENQTEPSPEQKEEAKKKDDITENENRILKSLQKPGYTWRYAKTIAGEVSISLQETEKSLSTLMSRGLAKSGKASNGKDIWAITILGKNVQEQHEFSRA